MLLLLLLLLLYAYRTLSAWISSWNCDEKLSYELHINCISELGLKTIQNLIYNVSLLANVSNLNNFILQLISFVSIGKPGYWKCSEKKSFEKLYETFISTNAYTLLLAFYVNNYSLHTSTWSSLLEHYETEIMYLTLDLAGRSVPAAFDNVCLISTF